MSLDVSIDSALAAKPAGPSAKPAGPAAEPAGPGVEPAGPGAEPAGPSVPGDGLTQTRPGMLPQRSVPPPSGEDPTAAGGGALAFSWGRWLWRFGIGVLTAPFRAYRSLRRSMTIASVSFLLSAFMTLNVIWGFPWSGMMGASLAVLMVGLAINRLMSPNLKVSVSLPRSAVAGNPFSVNVRLSNPRRLPALELRVGWHEEGIRDIYAVRRKPIWDASDPVNVAMLRSGDHMHWHGAIRYDSRGIHDLPPFRIVSTFPFHFFYCRRAVDTQTKIAITPAPASSDDDPSTRAMLTAIGDWSQKLVVGAPVEYVGNREYQVGVPVRRWDFASWARLGRPIVREYQSPSIQAVSLIVDTSRPEQESAPATRAMTRRRNQESDEAFERLMSIAATAIAAISSRRVHLNLFVTSETNSEGASRRTAARVSDGTESMLVRLAAATPVESQLGEERIREAIQFSRSQPTLIVSMIDLKSPQRHTLVAQLPPSVTYIPVRPPRVSATDLGEGDLRDR